MADSGQEKTEEATPERRRKAREEGQFPRGKDAGNTVGSLVVLLAIAGFSEPLVQLIGDFSWQCFHELSRLARGGAEEIVMTAGKTLAAFVLPLVFAASLGAFAVGLGEAGFHPNLDLAMPKWNRLEPTGKLKQMFSPQTAIVNVALQLGRVLAVGFVAWLCVFSAFPELVRLSSTPVNGGVVQVSAALLRLSLWASLALFLLVVVDYLVSYFKHEKQIMMSRQEIKDEHKQQEGDPRIRARQRARAREMSKRNMSRAVQAADFVVANPTHVSVAIRYRAEEGAPVVMTKGYDDVALHIRELAREHNVPIIENIPLARALAKSVKIGRQIPVDLYAAVAEILALVYRMKNRSLMG